MPAPGGKFAGSSSSSRGYAGGSKYGSPQTGAAGTVSGGSVRSTAGGGGYGGYGGATSTGRPGAGYSGSSARSSPEGGGGRGSPAGGYGGGRQGGGMGFQGGRGNAYQQGFANSPQRMMAVSRGPGLLTSYQSLNPRAQNRALTSIGLSLGEKLGLPGNMGIDKAHLMAKTAAGELGRYGQLDYDAATRTMTNRMDLAGKSLAERDFNKIMEAYDANRMAPRTRTAKGLKQTKGAYQGFLAAEPGTPNYQKGLYSIANAMSPYSEFSLTAPQKIQAATHYYSGPRTQPYQQNFAQYGPHKFGSPDYSTGQVQMARNTALGLPGASPPTQFAGREPTITPAGYTTPRAKPSLPAAFSGGPVLAGMPRAKPASPALRSTMAQAFSTARPMTLGGGLSSLGRRGGRTPRII